MKGTYNELTYQEVLKYVGNKRYIIIDIRPDYEYDAYHISGAVSIPEYELIQNYQKLSPEYTYIFICKKGKNSKDIAQTLAYYGYHTINLIKGMEAVFQNEKGEEDS